MDRITDQLGHLQLGNASEHLDWLPNPIAARPQLDREQLCEWLTIGPADLGDIHPYDFCAPTLIDRLVDAHRQQDSISDEQKTKAGKRLNPFEAVGKQFFSTRTAMKCANLDALLRFTNPMRPDGRTPLVNAGEQFTYADITNSDDFGVVEYMQWRKGQYATGFAFNTGSFGQPWRHALPASRPQSQLVQGVRGSSTAPATIREFIDFVRFHQPDGVHLAYSEHMLQPDGRSVHIRENLVKQQVLSYCALCLAVVREHGTMVVKLMETFTPFTVGLIYLLRQCFEQMCVIKPNSSRASSGERYLMLRWRLPDVDAIREHLLCTNESLVRMAEQHSNDVVELVPLDVLRADGAFDAYMRDCNERMAVAQTKAIRERMRFIETPPHQHRIDIGQKLRMRITCLQQWNVPDFDDITIPSEYVKRLSIWACTPVCGVNEDMQMFTDIVKDFGQGGRSDAPLKDWFFAAIAQPQSLAYFVSMGMGRISMWTGSEWVKEPRLEIELPSGTLLYGEVVCEAMAKLDANVSLGTDYHLHIIDVMCLHFELLHRKPLNERRRRLRDLVQTTGDSKMRVRNFFPVSQLCSWVKTARMGWKLVDGASQKKLMFKASADKWYPAGGVAFYRCDGRSTIGKAPLYWKWGSNVHKLLNDDVDQPTYFKWFEKRLAALKPARFEERRGPKPASAQPWGIYRRPRN